LDQDDLTSDAAEEQEGQFKESLGDKKDIDNEAGIASRK